MQQCRNKEAVSHVGPGNERFLRGNAALLEHAPSQISGQDGAQLLSCKHRSEGLQAMNASEPPGPEEAPLKIQIGSPMGTNMFNAKGFVIHGKRSAVTFRT